MKDINVKVSTRLSVIIGAIVLLILVGLVAFSYKEMSSMRRDLYAVRADYYNYYSPGKDESSPYNPVGLEIVSQEVRDLRIIDNNKVLAAADLEADPYANYSKQPVRVVKVKATNNESFNTSLGAYNFGYVNNNGVIVRSSDVHPDDNQNKSANMAYGIELAPGGSTELFVYFQDEGVEIEKLLYLQ